MILVPVADFIFYYYFYVCQAFLCSYTLQVLYYSYAVGILLEYLISPKILGAMTVTPCRRASTLL